MNKIKFSKDSYFLPSSWHEMSTKSLVTLSKLVINYKDSTGILFKLALKIMGMRMAYRKSIEIDGKRHFYIRQGRNIYLVTSAQMAPLIETLSFIFQDNDIKPVFVKNPFPELKTGIFKKLLGPADGLTNITFGEFIQAEIQRSAWNDTKNEAHLNNFLAILWRPPAHNHADGDKRVPLLQDTVDKTSKAIARQPPHIKQVMTWFYYGCLDFLYNKFDYVFSPGEPGKISTFDSFMNLVGSLAKNDLSKFDTVRNSPLYDALYNLQSIMENQEKLKSK